MIGLKTLPGQNGFHGLPQHVYCGPISPDNIKLVIVNRDGIVYNIEAFFPLFFCLFQLFMKLVSLSDVAYQAGEHAVVVIARDRN